jgi:peptide/nickel transport system substrate-binding protein
MRFEIPKADMLRKSIRSFSVTENFIFWIFTSIFIVCGVSLLFQVNNLFLVSVPDHGGELTEGVIGNPRFINPLLAMSDADKDLTSLIYSGLVKATPEGTVVPDLAEHFDVSDDGKTYTFFMRDDAKFQDGSAVTTDDVEFTVLKAQDPAIKSPRRPNWDGVIVEKVSNKEIRFTLKQAYAPFLENATIGILPKHIWKNATPDEFAFSEFNTTPIGSGPYFVKTVGRNSAGIPNVYTLNSNPKYIGTEPFISTLILRFYSNEADLAQALDQGDIESANGLSAEVVSQFTSQGKKVITTTLPRVFAVFFNQNQATVFANKEVRLALNTAVDKNAIVEKVLHGYGKVIDSPIPYNKETNSNQGNATTTSKIVLAKSILEKAGWKMSSSTGIYEKKTKKETIKLSFSISTGDAPELKATAQMLKDNWAKIGAQVDVQIYETGDLNQNIIRARKYDALLFGEIVGRDRDLYPFWHSSQRNDPGLNIAQYVNSTADKLLESARGTSDNTKRDALYAKFEDELQKDMPVVFLYSPNFLYVVPSKVQNITVGEMTIPGDRFLNINKWFIEQSRVWKFFTKN